MVCMHTKRVGCITLLCYDYDLLFVLVIKATTMTDWSQIIVESMVVAADLGLTYLFYKLYRDKCAAANQLAVSDLYC